MWRDFTQPSSARASTGASNYPVISRRSCSAAFEPPHRYSGRVRSRAPPSRWRTSTAETQQLRRSMKDALAESARLAERAERLESSVRTLEQSLAAVALRESQLSAIYRLDRELENDVAGLPGRSRRGRNRRAHAARPRRGDAAPTPVSAHRRGQRVARAVLRRAVEGRPAARALRRSPDQQAAPGGAVRVVATSTARACGTFWCRRCSTASWPRCWSRSSSSPSGSGCSPTGRCRRTRPPSACRFQSTDGRILLRHRGYLIPPHRDPKWGLITCLMYLARPGDSEAWGTQLYSVESDVEAPSVAAYSIKAERCRLREGRAVPPQQHADLPELGWARMARRIPTGGRARRPRTIHVPVSRRAYGLEHPRADAPAARRAASLWAGKVITDYN